MANSQFKIGTFNKSTNTGTPVNQAITGIGFTPKALILFSTQVTAEDSNSAGLGFCLGFSDGTDERSIWTGSKDNVGISDGNRYASDSKIINLRSPSSGGALQAEADLKSFDADGFTLTWTTNNASAFIIKYIAIGGDDITADVFEFTQKTSTGSQSVSTSLNTADFVLLASIGNNVKNSVITSMLATVGMASGPSNEGATCVFAADNAGTSVTNRFQRTNRVHLVGTNDSPQTTQAQAEFTNFTTTGFDLNYLNADASARYIFGLTIKGGTWEVGNDVTKASIGTQAYTTTVKPVGMFQFSTANIVNSLVATQTKLALGGSSGATESEGVSVTDEDAQGTTDSYRRSSSTYLMNLLNTTDGSVIDRASLDSFNATDFTLNFNDADAIQREFIWAVLKEAAGSGTSMVAGTSTTTAAMTSLRGLAGQSDGHASLQAVVSPLVGFSVMVLGQGRVTAQISTGSQSGGVTLTQSSTATFPDRPSVSGMGMLVSMASGNGSGYVEHDLGIEQSVLHTRVLLNPVTVSGGVVVMLAGLDQWGVETFRVTYDAGNRLVTVVLSTSETLAATLFAGVPWHCIELKIDTVNGQSELWLNGISMGSVTGVFTSLVTRRLLLGAVIKDVAVAGDLYLDEWVMADGYIGPVVVEPSSLYADDPARWVVIYNSAEADSVVWAESYRQARGVPFANLIGLSLSTAETIDLAQWLSLFNSINGYLANNGLGSNVLGILVGHLVPGYVDIDGMGFIEAIPALLHHTGSTPVFNPLSADGIPVRPTSDNLGGFRLTARVDGPALIDAQALTSRSDAIMTNGLGDGSSSTIWFDPYTDPGPGTDPQIESMANWHVSVDRMRMHLPLQLSAASNPQQEVQFSQIDNDGFFWGWSAAIPPAGFFGSLSGSRVFCFQLHTASPTGPTLRSTTPTNWMDTAIVAGYAASVGSSRAYSLSAVPFVRPFMEGLRLGWTLAESWFVANPVPGEGLFLVGDPLMTVRTPHAGWDIFGPLSRLEEIQSDTPIVALRDDELAVTLTDLQRPLQGEQAYYLIRHIDSQGRSEAGVRLVRVMHNAGLAIVPPLAPIWPDTEGWPVLIENGFARLVVVWDGPVRDRAQAVILEGQIDGGNTQVLQTITVDSVEAILLVEQTLPVQSARYRWLIQTDNGAAIYTPWSETIGPNVSSSASLQLIEV